MPWRVKGCDGDYRTDNRVCELHCHCTSFNAWGVDSCTTMHDVSDGQDQPSPNSGLSKRVVSLALEVRALSSFNRASLRLRRTTSTRITKSAPRKKMAVHLTTSLAVFSLDDEALSRPPGGVVDATDCSTVDMCVVEAAVEVAKSRLASLFL